MSVPTSHYQLFRLGFLLKLLITSEYFINFWLVSFSNFPFVYVHQLVNSHLPLSFTYTMADWLIYLMGEQLLQLDENNIFKSKEECACWQPRQLSVSHWVRLLAQQPARPSHKVQMPPMQKADIDRHKCGRSCWWHQCIKNM